MTPVSSDELAKAVQQRNLAHLSHVTADQYACITDWSGNTLLHQAAAHGLCLGIPGATADRLRQVRNVNGGTPIHNAFWADQLHTIPGLTLSLLHQLKLGGETLLDWAMRRPGDQFVPAGRRPFGPYTYSTGTSTVDLDKGNRKGSGLFHAQPPATARRMLTQVENPSVAECTLEVGVNDQRRTFTVPAGKTMEVSVDLPGGSGAVRVSYAGDKSLVLLQTRFAP